MLRLWLTLRDPVGPREYLWSGLALMALKYAVDAGAVWYTLDMQPGLYWRLWGDALISRIHQRVLAHVRALAEA